MVTVAKTARSQRTRAALVTAVHDRLATEGTFTAEAIAEAAGCAPATFWAHFGTKDDAIAAAFEVALDDLVGLAATLFAHGVGHDVEAWATDVVDRLVDYFAARALLFRSAIARFPDHPGMRAAYRSAEDRAVSSITTGLGHVGAHDDAVAVLVFCQGLNNPGLLRTHPGSPVRRRLATALVALVDTRSR